MIIVLILPTTWINLEEHSLVESSDKGEPSLHLDLSFGRSWTENPVKTYQTSDHGKR